MEYVWTYHAASERLPKRSGLTPREIEKRLDQRKYIVYRKRDGWYREHRLIWDEVAGYLIDVPLLYRNENCIIIPTVMVVTNVKEYPEWLQVQAERAWFHFKDTQPDVSMTDKQGAVTATLTRSYRSISGWPKTLDLVPLLSWLIQDSAKLQPGDVGMLALFRDLNFCLAIKELLHQWKRRFPLLAKKSMFSIRIEKGGERRSVPISFFLSTP